VSEDISRTELKSRIEVLIRAHYPILYVTTWEEERALNTLREVAHRLRVSFVRWTISEGMVKEGGHAEPMNQDKVLDTILRATDPTLFVLQDYHHYMTDPDNIRKLRDIVIAFRQSRRALVLLSPTPAFALPVELEKDITLIEYDLPSPGELSAVLERIITQALEAGGQVALNADNKDQLVKAMQGLTNSQAENVLQRCLVTDGKLEPNDIDIILREKEQIIRKSGILEFYSSPEKFDSIGGLTVLKDWFNKRKDAFSERASQFGLPAPKGILLIGVPGCGKSLCAKALAAQWDKPLLRFDVGRIFGGLVGQSEQNMRKAIQVAESVSPTILWIDEIEKGFAGMRGRGDSGGVVSRVFGTLLTWMQDKAAPVFVIATANDISQLPPELVRKGRFDEIFFVDLPFDEEREQIFRIHLTRRLARQQQDLSRFDLKELVSASRDFSGAEIEQVIISALFDAFGQEREEERVLTQALLLDSIAATTPLAKTMEPEINGLRRWAQTRCRYASMQRYEPTGPGEYRAAGDSFELWLPDRQS
jgi:ATP-dependent 26S proteasome regulatory subunit